VFQTDGQKDGFHWPGMSYVNSGMGMKFGPVKEAIKRLLVFLAQSPPKWFPPVPFRFQDMAIRQKCAAQFFLPSGGCGAIKTLCPPKLSQIIHHMMSFQEKSKSR
jgi:hypothetical protein